MANGDSSGQQVVKRRAQAVDIAGWPHPIEPARRLLWTHVRRRAQRLPGARQLRIRRGQYRVGGAFEVRFLALLAPCLLPAAHGLRQAPVHDQRFAELAEHDVARLQIAVQHAAAVRIGNGVADGDKPIKQLAKFEIALCRAKRGGVKAFDGLLEAVAADEAHGVVRPAIGILAEGVDRHDAGMFQTAGDLRLAHKAGTTFGVICVPRLDLFQRHLAVQLAVAGHEDLAQPPAGMGPQNLETRPVGRDVGNGGQRVVNRRRRARQLGQTGVQLAVGDAAQLRAYRFGSGQRRQATLGVVAVLFEMAPHQPFEQFAIGRGEGALIEQDLP